MSDENEISSFELGNMETNIDNSSDDVTWDNVDDVSLDAEETDSSEGESAEEVESVKEVEDFEDEEEIQNEEEEESKEAKAESEDSKEEAEEAPKSNEPELIEVKVNGELQKVTLDELKSNYSGKVAFDKKFSELDQERQAYKKQIEEVNAYVSELGKTMRDSSVLEGVFKIGELNNIGPHQIKRALIDELMPEINRLMDLSQDQADLEYNKADLEYNKQLQEKTQADFERKQAESELQFKISKVMDSLEIDNQEWNDAVDFLDKNLPRSEELTPERVGEYVAFRRAETRATNELSIFENGAYAKNSDVMDALLEVIQTHPQFSSQDIQELLEEVYGSAKQDAAEQKVEKVVEKKSAKSKPVQKQPKSKSQFEELDSDDWDDIL